MHFTHILLKPTKRLEKKFPFIEELKKTEPPEESKQIANKFYKTNKLSDELGYDMLIELNDSIVYAFDILIDKKKIIIPELNPTTIFYSNAIMYYRNLIESKRILFEQSPDIKNTSNPVDPNLFGTYFQFAVNCLINLQSTVESFANRKIPENYFTDSEGKQCQTSIFEKIDNVLPKLLEKQFKKEFKRDNFRVRKIIELRNKIIHLQPIEETTNTQYKEVYRKMIKFDFSKAIIAVKHFVNFYEPELLEECHCGKEYFYQVSIIDK